LKASPVPAKRDDPGEAPRGDGPAKIHFDVVGTCECSLELRAVDERSRNSKTELPIEPITRAACQHAGPSADRLAVIVGGDADPLVRDGNRSDSRRAAQLDARGTAGIGQRLIEGSAIDNRGPHAIGIDCDGAPIRGDEARRVRGVEDGLTGNVEFGERIQTEKAGAMGGNADAGVFFEDHDVVTALGEPARRDQPGGPCSDDDDVTQHV
jgi:hypothetical protein